MRFVLSFLLVFNLAACASLEKLGQTIPDFIETSFQRDTQYPKPGETPERSVDSEGLATESNTTGSLLCALKTEDTSLSSSSVVDALYLGTLKREALDSPPVRIEVDTPYRPAAITQSGEQRQIKSAPANAPLIWDRIRQGFQLDLTQMNPRIKVQLDWYARNPAYIERTFNRAAPYLYHIVEEIDSRGLPMELALLPVVESAFDPFAYSHGRASGLWQFIPGTGKMYGLHQNWWYDGRRDVLASTDAAIRYLSSLNERFDGNWLHALASYNTGSGRVNRAIRNNRKLGKNTDFWSLKLPRETRAYVPKLLAISMLVAKPGDFEITLPPIPDKPVFEVVKLDSQLDLAQAANLADIEITELYRFNPGFNQWATDPDGPHRLLIPLDRAERFKQGLAALPRENRLTWNRYAVKRGDSLIRIARLFHTTPKLIRQVNRLRSNQIKVGQKLLIPVSSKGKTYYELSSQNRLERKQESLKVPAGSRKIRYTVQPGDTIWELSLKHKVGMRTLAKWNGMAPTDVLKPGKELLIYSKAPGYQASEELPALGNERKMIRRVGYRVRKGDSLARIASKFGVTIKELIAWNNIDRSKYLQPGQKITIFVDITQS